MRLVRKFGNGLRFWRNHGMTRCLEEAYLRSWDWFYERRFNVDTKGTVRLRDMDIVNADSVDYMPMRYVDIFRVLRQIPVCVDDCGFLDLGAGKGRAIVAAASLPFRSVRGVELVGALAKIAEDNIVRMKGKRARKASIQSGDASSYLVPEDVNVIYFYNPFRGPTLEKVFQAILESYDRAPRPIYIVFFNNDHFERVVAGNGSVQKVAQRYTKRHSLGVYRVEHHGVRPTS